MEIEVYISQLLTQDHNSDCYIMTVRHVLSCFASFFTLEKMVDPQIRAAEVFPLYAEMLSNLAPTTRRTHLYIINNYLRSAGEV
jgi:hypothetical protein